MYRVSVSINDVQENVRMFKTSQKAHDYAINRLNDLWNEKRGTNDSKLVDCATTVSLKNGSVTMHRKFADGTLHKARIV